MTHAEPTVLVVGGGPAGVVAAARLAAAGHATTLVDAGTLHASGPFESVLASARPWLDRLGFGPQLGDAAEVDPLRHGARWGGPELVWREDQAPGLLLRRGPFDRRLRALVQERGATVLEGARVVENGDGSCLVLERSGRVHGPWRPEIVVVATGRTTRARLPLLPTRPRTLAFGCVGEPAAEDRGTAVVEAVPDGWIWTYVPQRGAACATVFLDSSEVARVGRAVLLARAFAAAEGPAARLVGAKVLHATDATPAVWRGAVDERRLRIGDAMATIDPLASQGVEKAFAAGDHAAAVVHSALREPRWQSRLFGCHQRFELGVQAAHQRTAEEWYRREERFADQPFWASRRVPVARSTDDAMVRAANRPLRLASHVQSGQVLVRAGAEFVAADGAIDHHTGEEVARIGYVPIPALLARFQTPTTLPAAVADGANDARLFVLPPRAVHAALQELLRRGWLTPADGAPDSR
ncbi:MAG: tryptophan 7-halogenase [Planctomycetes bacterium]|nr:tryptophan 7-halogenase [Planctomycetota bacterium]